MRRFLLPILALALSAAAVAAVVTQRQPVEYESSVTLVVQTSAGANDTETLVRTMIALVDSEVIGEALRASVRSPLSADEITDNLAVDRPPGSSVLTVYYSDTDEARSVATAQALIPVFQEQVAGLEADQAGQLAPNYAIQPWGGGAVVTMESAPPILRNAAVAALLGALVGGLGASLYRQRNPLLRSGKDAAEAMLTPVVTTSRPSPSGGRGRGQWHPTDVADSVLQALPAALGRPNLPRRILVVGTETGRQRAAFVSHLARALQDEGPGVTLVDADLESGRLSRQLNLSQSDGLAECLTGDLLAEDAVVVADKGPAAGLRVLPAGRKLPVRSASAAVVLSGLDRDDGRLVIDAPPVSSQQSIGPLVRNADAVLLLISAGRSTFAEATSLASLVQSLGNAPAVTILLTDNPEHAPGMRVVERPPVPVRPAGAAARYP